MAAILLAGFVGYSQLPVSALPEVDYPIIQVLTFYPGAGPEVMASSVTAPLERQFGQMPGLKQMTSVSAVWGDTILWGTSVSGETILWGTDSLKSDTILWGTDTVTSDTI